MALVARRTRACETGRGLLVGVSWKVAGLTGDVFNPDASDPTRVGAFRLES